MGWAGGWASQRLQQWAVAAQLESPPRREQRAQEVHACPSGRLGRLQQGPQPRTLPASRASARGVWSLRFPATAAEDLLRDLEKELSDYSRERRAAKAGAAAGSAAGASAAGAAGGMKSLWEELADIGREIGEEFVEFLEEVGGWRVLPAAAGWEVLRAQGGEWRPGSNIWLGAGVSREGSGPGGWQSTLGMQRVQTRERFSLPWVPALCSALALPRCRSVVGRGRG